MKGKRVFAAKYFKKYLIVKYPKIVEEIIPIIKRSRFPFWRFPEIITSRNFFKPAPAIIGPEIIKANFAASALLRFKNKPAVIVEPDLEIPGIKASAWAKPIIRESRIPKWPVSFDCLPFFSAGK